MITLRLNVETGTAAIIGSLSVTVGQPCAVRIEFPEAPTVVQIQLGIGRPLLFPDSLLAFLDIDDFTVDAADDTVYLATLDGTDVRLARYMAARPEATIQLGIIGEVDGTPIATPYVNLTVQAGFIGENPNTQGGPTYPTLAQMTAAIAAAIAGIDAGAGIDPIIVKLTGIGSDPTSLDGQNTSLSGGYELGDFLTFNVTDANSAANSPSGICTYQLISDAAAVTKYGASTDNLPYIVRPNDWSAGAPVWERRS